MAGKRPTHRRALGGPVLAALATLASVAIGSLALGVGPASAALACGATIHADKTLKEDLECESGTDGLTFDNSGIKLDLNGHTISGPSEAGSSGVLVLGPSNAKIINGKIRGFGNAVRAGSMEGLTLRKLDVKDSAEASLTLNSVVQARVTESRLRSPGNQVNVFVDGLSASVEVGENELRGGKLHFAQGQELSAIGNEIVEPAVGGIDVDDVTGAVIRRNHVDQPGISAAIAVNFETEDARIGRNVVEGGFSTGIAALVQSSQVRITHNEVRDTAGHGILVGVMTTDIVVRKNVVKGVTAPGQDGIFVDDADVLIEGNTANRNADYGIESDSANGSGNLARNNGNPAQCSPASLCE